MDPASPKGYARTGPASPKGYGRTRFTDEAPEAELTEGGFSYPPHR